MTRVDYLARLRGRRMFGGMDLSATKDLTAMIGLFPDDTGFDVLAEFFVPEESITERERRDRVPYRQWVREGWLHATPGNVVDYEAVRHQWLEWASLYDIRTIGYDPWNATDLVTRMTTQDGLDCVPMRQGFPSLSAPTKSLEKAILARKLRHDGHPILRWNISNAAVEQDPAGNVKLSKKASTERIDGAYALVMAMDQMDRNAGAAQPQFQMIVVGAR